MITGAAVSMETEIAADATEVLPAPSVAVAVSAVASRRQGSAVADGDVPVARRVGRGGTGLGAALIESLTVEPASALPLIVGVRSLVTLSVFDAPLSLALLRSGAEMVGAAVSTVIVRPDDVRVDPLTLAVTVRLWLPWARGLLVMLQLPELSACVEPRSGAVEVVG